MNRWGWSTWLLMYVRNCFIKSALLMTDIYNSFNCLRRDSFLSVVRDNIYGLYCFLWQAYSSSTTLFIQEQLFALETGIKLGDPIGSALFALMVDKTARRVQIRVQRLISGRDDSRRLSRENSQWFSSIIGKEHINYWLVAHCGSKCELTILKYSMPEETEALFRVLFPWVRVVSAGRA